MKNIIVIYSIHIPPHSLLTIIDATYYNWWFSGIVFVFYNWRSKKLENFFKLLANVWPFLTTFDHFWQISNLWPNGWKIPCGQSDMWLRGLIQILWSKEVVWCSSCLYRVMSISNCDWPNSMTHCTFGGINVLAHSL